MPNPYDWQIDPTTGQLVNTGTPDPTAPPGVTLSGAPQPTPQAPAPSGANAALMSPLLNAASGAGNNIYNWSANALAAAHKAAANMHPSTWGQQASDAAAVEGGNPNIAKPISSGQNPAPTLPQPDHMPWPPSPRAQVPPGAPLAAQPPAAAPGGQPPYGNPWDPQGVGYARSWDPQGVAAAAAARMGGPPAGALAAQGQQPNSPFTMVMRPNAPANDSGGRGGGGPALGTALDLSGYRPPPPAPPSINLGYGAPGGPGGAPPVAVSPHARAQAPAQPYNPFTHVWRDPAGSRVPVGQSVTALGSGVVQGRGGTELLNPGQQIWNVGNKLPITGW
jgi:hypothetical protein